MKKIVFALFICFFLLNTGAKCNSADSLHLYSWKIIGAGSLILISGWEPRTGSFYPLEWYDYNGVSSHSVGFQYGLTFSKKLFRSGFYLAAGASFSKYLFGKFSTTPKNDQIGRAHV